MSKEHLTAYSYSGPTGVTNRTPTSSTTCCRSLEMIMKTSLYLTIVAR